MTAEPAPRPAAALDEHDLAVLESELDALAGSLDPLDVSAVDGFLCGVLVQPVALPASQWLRFVCDSEGRPLPAGIDATRLHGLVMRRHAELDRAIGARQWFDPWVFELDDAATPSECVAPWVAGFSLATERFPALTRMASATLIEPLALLYRHVDPADLEDADELLEVIDLLEPPSDLSEAVEELVRATLLLADVSRPSTPRSNRPHRTTGARGATQAARRSRR